MAITCKMCGTENAEGIEFCAACGSAMTDEAAKPKPQAAQGAGVPAKTIMFGQAPQAAQSAPAAPEAKKKEPAKTMLGMPAVGGSGSQPAPMATPQQPAQPAPMARPQQSAQPAPMATPQTAAKPAAKPAAQQRKSSSRAHTVLGLPAVVDAAQAKAKAQAAQPTQAAPMAQPQQAPKAAAKPVADDKRTVLGLPAVGGDAAETQAKVAQATAPAASPSAPATPKPRPSTEPLEPMPKRHEPTKPDPNFVETIAADSAPGSPADSWPDEPEPTSPKKGGGALIIVAIVAALVVFAGGGVLVYLLLFRDGAELKPQVFSSGDGKNLTVVLAFPEAPPGTTLQVQGQQLQVSAGRASFDLPIDQMVLGENPIPVVYTEPGSAPEKMTFPILMRHKVADDLSGLGTADPFFVVVFSVAPEIQLAVSGQPAQVANNTYSHRVTLAEAMAGAPASDDSLIHKLTFQLTDATGQTEQGEHVITIPVTKTQIDRPGQKAVVTFEEVTCSGTTEEGAQVTVNERPVSVIARRFSTTVQFAELGDHEITVTARAPGKAPGTRTVKVTRIESLDQAIAAWSADLDTKLDFPTLARDPNAYNERKIKLSGRVVNINTENRATAFLLYVGEGCPAGARCAVHAVFAGETDAGLQSLVDVYGTVRGTHDVDLRGGEKETMPAIEAVYVVKQEDSKGKRRRKR